MLKCETPNLNGKTETTNYKYVRMERCHCCWRAAPTKANANNANTAKAANASLQAEVYSN